MKYDKFSQKQIKAMLWWKMDRYRGFDAIVCDGSVRSGKTLSMTIGLFYGALKTIKIKTSLFVVKQLPQYGAIL